MDSWLTLMLAPFPVARGLVVDAGQKAEVLQRHLLLLDAELVVQLALGGVFDAQDGVREVRARLVGHVQRVRAARVCPHVGEGDLLGGALLEEELVLVVEEEDGEGAVEEPLVDVGHEVACERGVPPSQRRRSLEDGARAGRHAGDLQSFLLAVPIGMSFSSRTMHTSSIRRICSSSWPSRASPLVSMSGKRRRMLSAVMGVVVVVVVVAMVLLGAGRVGCQGGGKQVLGRGGHRSLTGGGRSARGGMGEAN